MELKLYLVRNGITVTQFAKELGCSRPHIDSIVNGRRSAGASLAKLIQIKTNNEIKEESLIK